jgi:hypothetical protein
MTGDESDADTEQECFHELGAAYRMQATVRGEFLWPQPADNWGARATTYLAWS